MRIWTIQELRKAGGPFVGPQGGLYADPQHTVAWDPKKHGKVPTKHCPRCSGVGHVVSRQTSLIPGGETTNVSACRTCNKDGKVPFHGQLPLLKARKLHRRRTFAGMDISVENQVGSYRYWWDEHANEQGRTRMQYDYGYIRRTEGTDGDHIDVYIGPDKDASMVYIVDQGKKGKWDEFDEQKVMLGFSSREAAKEAYLAHYNDPRFFQRMHVMSVDEFRELALASPEHGRAITKAFVVPLVKGEARGGKYIKRTPYTDGKGRRRYRYYYADSAIGRDTRAGEDVRLGKKLVHVVDVEPNGTIRFELGGHVHQVSPSEWRDLIGKHYGERYFKHAEKRAHQAMDAVLRHVPRSLLKDLTGTDEERLKELQERVPTVYAKLQRAFQRAGVSPFKAKEILAHSLERRGWAPEARATAVGSVLEGRTSARNFRQIVDAAENLSGGSGVTTAHAAAAIELRSPGGRESNFVESVATIARSAEVELAQLSKLLNQARAGDGEAEALVHGLVATATQKLALLATAFPGLRDKAIEPARETLLELPSVAPKKKPTTEGAHTHVFVAGEGGKPVALKARYKLMEAKDIIASHDPSQGFRKREDYPEGVQERAYHRDKTEQIKVLRNAQTLEPAFVVNTNPDAVNGPPMITEDGIALGGNSRTMSMQKAYADFPAKAKEMKEYLRDHAHEVGLAAEDVDAMDNPILVRVVDVEDKSKANMQILVRQMNESFTQSMDPRTMQVALSRKLDEQTLDSLAEDMDDDETLNAFLGTSRSERFVNALFKAGIIDQRNANQYITKGTKRLNEDGRTLVARILVGKVIGDADLLSNTRSSMVTNIAMVVPYIVRAKSHGDSHDLSEDLGVALSAYNDLIHRVETKAIPPLAPDMPDQRFQGLFNYFDSLFEDKHPIMSSPRAKTLLEVLIRKGSGKHMPGIFREYAKRASENREDQSSMFGAGPSSTEILSSVVASHMKKSMGPLLTVRS